MKRLLVRRSAAGLALGALAATGLASVPTAAQAVITSAEISSNTYFDDNECSSTVSAPDPADAPFSDNGVPVTLSHSVTGTSTDGVNPADISDLSASSTMTATVSPVTGGPATITVTGSAHARALPRIANSVCEGYARGYERASGDFVLTQPTWVTITATASGKGGSSFGEVYNQTGDLYLQTADRSQGTVSALFPAGPASFYFSVEANADATDAGRRTADYAASYKVDLQPVGTATAAAGKGKAYAVFGARDCATGNVTADITKKAKKKAKQILVKVNGKKVANLKGKKLKKRTLVLPAAPSSAAEVVATITLKNGKKVTVTRSYLACS